MRDHDVRTAVRLMLAEKHGADDDTRIVEEMGVWSGSVRIDIAVINGELSGFELKSDRDTLERLPSQCDLYGRVFDRVILVAGSRHLGKAVSLIPSWWGVIRASLENGVTQLALFRDSGTNPAPDPYLVAQLLWKEEAVTVLEAFGIAKGWRSKPVQAIHKRLAAELPWVELSHCVRSALKRRANWLGQSICDKRKMPVDTYFDPARSAP